ncbi:conserved membrane hypothetical protein [Alteromonas alvinellae]|uniref:DoxX family protein n=1 Tax=Alteromonas naphthalenivorans TaxID=715451 RepID=F5ZFG8_ALTNA|nr:hypothetical protein ambt_18020 [Alteromonas naphthalenivorans]
MGFSSIYLLKILPAHNLNYGATLNGFIVTAILELIAAGLIFYQGTRLYGSALATVIMIFAVVTLWRHKEFAHSIPAVIALILLVLLCFVVIVTP